MESNREGVFSISSLPVQAGYMWKKGGVAKGTGSGRRNWKKRWFKFSPIEYREKEAYELQYFDSKDGELKGTVGLFDIEVYCETKSTHKRVKFEFQLLLQNGGIFQLSCDTEEEREKWIASLNIVIAYLRKVVLSSGFSISGYDPTYEDEEECYIIGEEIGKKCKAFGPGLVGAEAGHKTHFLIQVNDMEGQPMTEGGMPITATISDETHLFYIRIIDNQDGTYSGYYAIGHPGVYDLHIRLNDEHNIEGSPYAIEILPTRTLAENCIAAGENIHSCYPGITSSFIIYAKDIYSNNKQKGGDPFEVSIVGPATLQSLMDNGDGSYTCCFEARNASDLTYFAPSSLLMSVTLYGKHISGSPYHPTILSQPPPAIIPSIISANHHEEEDEIDSISYHTKDAAMMEEKNTIESSNQALTMSAISGDASVTDKKISSSAATTSSAAAAAQLRISTQKRNSILTKEISKIEESSGAPLSRLERARQRAMMARNLMDTHSQYATNPNATIQSPSAASASTSIPFANNSNSSVDPPSSDRGVRRASVMRTDIDPITGLPTNIGKNKGSTLPSNQQATTSKKVPSERGSGAGNWNITDAELNKLLNPQPTITASVSASADRTATQNRRAVQRTDVDPMTGLPVNLKTPISPSKAILSSTNQPTQVADKPLSSSDSLADAISIATGNSNMSKAEIDNILASFSGGLSGSIPPGAGADERVMWEYTDQALLSADVIHKLITNLPILKSSYDLMSTIVEGTQILKLTNNSNSSGAFRLLEEFDVVPAYLSMREIKKAFSLILVAQRNAKTASSIAGGGTGIDFAHYIKLLVMLAVYGLSKTTAFAALYKTPVAKVDVMLHKWGLADKTRVQLVKNELSSR